MASGLFGSDTLGSVTSGTASFTTLATSTDHVGSYLITGAGLAGNSTNYNFSFIQAAGNASALTINPAALTITYTANAASRLYGNANPALSGSAVASGLFGSDTLASVTSGTASFTSLATGTNHIGSYLISGAGLAGNSTDYSFNFIQATGNASALTITARPLTVTADAQSRAFGAANPPLTFVSQGLVNEDSLTGALDTLANTTSPAGSYAITQGTLAASQNYQLSYIGNNLVVKAGPSVTPGSQIETNLASQIVDSSQEEQEQQQEAEDAGQHAASPKVLISTVVDSDNVTQPVPVDEPVTSNGNVGQ